MFKPPFPFRVEEFVRESKGGFASCTYYLKRDHGCLKMHRPVWFTDLVLELRVMSVLKSRQEAHTPTCVLLLFFWSRVSFKAHAVFLLLFVSCGECSCLDLSRVCVWDRRVFYCCSAGVLFEFKSVCILIGVVSYVCEEH